MVRLYDICGYAYHRNNPFNMFSFTYDLYSSRMALRHTDTLKYTELHYFAVYRRCKINRDKREIHFKIALSLFSLLKLEKMKASIEYNPSVAFTEPMFKIVTGNELTLQAHVIDP